MCGVGIWNLGRVSFLVIVFRLVFIVIVLVYWLVGLWVVVYVINLLNCGGILLIIVLVCGMLVLSCW